MKIDDETVEAITQLIEELSITVQNKYMPRMLPYQYYFILISNTLTAALASSDGNEKAIAKLVNEALQCARQSYKDYKRKENGK